MAQQRRWIFQPQGPQRFERCLSWIPRFPGISGIPRPPAPLGGSARLLSTPFAAQARWWSNAQAFIRCHAGAISSLLKLAVKRLLRCRWLPIISNWTCIAEGVIVQGIGAISFLFLEEIQIIVLRTLIPSHSGRASLRHAPRVIGPDGPSGSLLHCVWAGGNPF